MNRGESGSEKKRELLGWNHIQYAVLVQLPAFVCMNHNFHRLHIDFFLTHAHPKFVYKLDINNNKTVSNEKDMTNFFN